MVGVDYTSGDGGSRVWWDSSAIDGVLMVSSVSQDGEDPGRVSGRRELLHSRQSVLGAGVSVLLHITVQVPVPRPASKQAHYSITI